MFQLGHFFAEMDRGVIEDIINHIMPSFQLGHFFAEMDRNAMLKMPSDDAKSFNWATSSQKWIDLAPFK